MPACPILISKEPSSCSAGGCSLNSTGSHRVDLVWEGLFWFLNFRSQYHNCRGVTLWAAHHSLAFCPLARYSAILFSHSFCCSALVTKKTLLVSCSEEDYPIDLGMIQGGYSLTLTCIRYRDWWIWKVEFRSNNCHWKQWSKGHI
jgi:hypothetical protein